MVELVKFVPGSIVLDSSKKIASIAIPNGGLVLKEGFETFTSSSKFENVVRFNVHENKSVNLYNSLSFKNSKDKDTYFTVKKLAEIPELKFDELVCGVVNVHLWSLLSEEFLRELVIRNKHNLMNFSIDLALKENDKHRFNELLEIKGEWEK